MPPRLDETGKQAYGSQSKEDEMRTVAWRVIWGVCCGTVWGAYGCGSEEGTAEEGDTGTETDTGFGTGTGSGNGDGGVGTDPATGLCPGFTARLVACGADAESLPEVEDICGKFASVFNEGFLQAIYGCLEQASCEDLLVMVETTDAGIPTIPEEPSLVETCMMTAMLTAGPGPTSERFQQHYCDWLVSCDTTVGPNECRASFTSNELMIFTVMADSFVQQADACVNPPPPCENAQAVEICLTGVRDSFVQAFEI